ncbi:hypothetical protein Taro_038769 [Colocasia esculenta]|uniref:Uncharacterized protein n=1 Tax=Colocasia esculenta TaxID=4460 RepID=A0A843WTN0_COLES|nr:hypothetical protein [Colocasia esculenta]
MHGLMLQLNETISRRTLLLCGVQFLKERKPLLNKESSLRRASHHAAHILKESNSFKNLHLPPPNKVDGNQCPVDFMLTSRSMDADLFVLDINSGLASSVVVRRLIRNASLVGYPRFFVSQAHVFVVLGSRFDSFEVCPSVGTVVTAVVACGVPEWWHNFGYG